MSFDAAIAESILGHIAEHGSLRGACAREGMPSASTFLRWCDAHPALAERYARAKLVGLEVMADEITHIADTPLPGVTKTIKADGAVEEKHGDMIEHRRLQIDARKWLLSKLIPKKYGEKLEHDVGGMVQHNHTLSFEDPKQVSSADTFEVPGLEKPE